MNKEIYKKAKVLVEKLEKLENTINDMEIVIDHVKKGGQIKSRTLDFSFKHMNDSNNRWISLMLYTTKREQLLLLNERLRRLQSEYSKVKVDFKCL